MHPSDEMIDQPTPTVPEIPAGWHLVPVEPAERFRVSLFWSDEDDAYIAETPDLPGCCATGATRGAALAELAEAAIAWRQAMAARDAAPTHGDSHD